MHTSVFGYPMVLYFLGARSYAVLWAARPVDQGAHSLHLATHAPHGQEALRDGRVLFQQWSQVPKPPATPNACLHRSLRVCRIKCWLLALLTQMRGRAANVIGSPGYAPDHTCQSRKAIKSSKVGILSFGCTALRKDCERPAIGCVPGRLISHSPLAPLTLLPLDSCVLRHTWSPCPLNIFAGLRLFNYFQPANQNRVAKRWGKDGARKADVCSVPCSHGFGCLCTAYVRPSQICSTSRRRACF